MALAPPEAGVVESSGVSPLPPLELVEVELALERRELRIYVRAGGDEGAVQRSEQAGRRGAKKVGRVEGVREMGGWGGRRRGGYGGRVSEDTYNTY